jgi:hypothetical protein
VAEGLRLGDRVWLSGPDGRPRFGEVHAYWGPADARRLVVRWEDGQVTVEPEAECRRAARDSGDRPPAPAARWRSPVGLRPELRP